MYVSLRICALCSHTVYVRLPLPMGAPSPVSYLAKLDVGGARQQGNGGWQVRGGFQAEGLGAWEGRAKVAAGAWQGKGKPKAVLIRINWKKQREAVGQWGVRHA